MLGYHNQTGAANGPPARGDPGSRTGNFSRTGKLRPPSQFAANFRFDSPLSSPHPMRILVLGSGAREHALCWRLALDPDVRHVIVRPW